MFHLSYHKWYPTVRVPVDWRWCVHPIGPHGTVPRSNSDAEPTAADVPHLNRWAGKVKPVLGRRVESNRRRWRDPGANRLHGAGMSQLGLCLIAEPPDAPCWAFRPAVTVQGHSTSSQWFTGLLFAVCNLRPSFDHGDYIVRRIHLAVQYVVVIDDT